MKYEFDRVGRQGKACDYMESKVGGKVSKC